MLEGLRVSPRSALTALPVNLSSPRRAVGIEDCVCPQPCPFPGPVQQRPRSLQGKSLSAAPSSPAQILAGGSGRLPKTLRGGRCCWLRLALAGVGLMMGKLRASPFFANMISSFLCPLGFRLWPQSPFIPYSRASWGPLVLMGTTVLPHLMQDGRPSQATVLGLEAGP